MKPNHFKFCLADIIIPSIAQLVERWTVVGLLSSDIHRSLVRIRLEGYRFSPLLELLSSLFVCSWRTAGAERRRRRCGGCGRRPCTSRSPSASTARSRSSPPPSRPPRRSAPSSRPCTPQGSTSNRPRNPNDLSQQLSKFCQCFTRFHSLLTCYIFISIPIWISGHH